MKNAMGSRGSVTDALPATSMFKFSRESEGNPTRELEFLCIIIMSTLMNPRVCDAFLILKKAIHAAASWHHVSWYWRSRWIGGALRKACGCFPFTLFRYICIISVREYLEIYELPHTCRLLATENHTIAAFLLPLQIYTWNTDAWGYNQNTISLYQSHPWVFSMLPTGEAFGALADTSLRCEVIINLIVIERHVPFCKFLPLRFVTSH